MKTWRAAMIIWFICTNVFSVLAIVSTFIMLNRIKVVSHDQVQMLVDKVSATQLQEMYLEQDRAMLGVVDVVHLILKFWLITTVLNVNSAIGYVLLNRRSLQ